MRILRHLSKLIITYIITLIISIIIFSNIFHVLGEPLTDSVIVATVVCFVWNTFFFGLVAEEKVDEYKRRKRKRKRKVNANGTGTSQIN